MRVQLSTDEWYPIYEVWHGFGNPEFDLDIPDELWNEYLTAMGNYLNAKSKLREFLGNE